MTIPRSACCLVAALAGLIGGPAARADVYVWVDAGGKTNVSNLAPPDNAKVTTVIHSVPRTAAQEEAARAAAQRAEMQVLNDRVAALQQQLEQSKREAAWMPAAYAPPPVIYAPQYTTWAPPQAPAPYEQDNGPSFGWGCDSPWNNCGFGFGGWPYVAVVVNNNGKHHHRAPGFKGPRPVPTPHPGWTGPVRPLGAMAAIPRRG
jgi:hypothetical protein